MKRLFSLSSLLLPALLLAGAFTVVRAQQGQTGTDPKSPFWIWLPQTGSMTGDSTMNGFGWEIHGVGDVDRSGTQDFLVRYGRTDTVVNDRNPREYRLYKGVSGGLPKVEDGELIRVDNNGTELQYYAAGDWNNDGNVDLAFSYYYEVDGSHAVIFWGSEQGTYSTDDTTELSNGVGSWTVREMVRMDADNNGIDDLFVRTWGLALMDTGLVATPKGYVLLGREKKTWQDNPVWEPTMRWWEPLVGTITVLDHDVDGHDDLIFRYRETGPTTLRAIYGRDGLFDTNAIMTVDLSPANGQGVAIGDITGDNVPELLMTTGSENIIRIYAGRRGQRLAEQFGSGFEGPHPERGEWWHRPWAELWMAPKLDDGFFGSPCVNVLGDVNLDGVNDILSCEDPWYIIYVTGDRLDSLIDAFIKGPSKVRGVWNLGDIDASSIPTFAVYYWEALLFYKATTEVSSAGKFRRLPHLPSSVEEEEGEQKGFIVQAIPNPSSGEVRIRWRNGEAEQRRSGDIRITIHDPLGKEVAAIVPAPGAPEAIWDASGVVGGTYFITVTVGEHSQTAQVLIQR